MSEYRKPEPVILAFMQNMWVRDPKRVLAAIEKHGETYRRRVIEYALFAGCLSGRRLEKAFGHVIRAIKWDEVSREISGHSDFVPTADPDHIRSVIQYYDPDMVITFGKIARDALDDIWKGPRIRAPHPAARGKEVPQLLKRAADELMNSRLTRKASIRDGD